LVSCRGLFIDNARKEQYILDDLLRSDLPSSGVLSNVKDHLQF